jgi:hypothetical protein
MEFNPVSLSLIEDTMLSYLKSVLDMYGSGLSSIYEFDARKGLDTINRTPAICVATESVGFRQVDECTVKWSPKVMLYMVFKNVSNEAARRRGVYPILEGVTKLLQLQTLGLDIEPLVPGLSADEIIHAAFEQRGYIGFKIPFTTSFDVEKYEEPQEAIKLLMSGIKYFMQPDDGENDSQDIVTFWE